MAPLSIRTDCDYCKHAWAMRATRWSPEYDGCDLEGEMSQDECDLAEVGKCPYFAEAVIEDLDDIDEDYVTLTRQLRKIQRD